MRMAPELRFLEHRHTVAANFEASAPRRNHLDVHLRKPRTQLGRQTDGPGLVVSIGAELDRDLHVAPPKEPLIKSITRRTRKVAGPRSTAGNMQPPRLHSSA